MKPQKLFFGTANAHKLEEVKMILGAEVQLLSFRDLPAVPEVEETEPTLEGNAALKARAFFALSGIPCFADDTGLEVEALHGAPGVYSARYAGAQADAAANRAKLLAAMEGVAHRKARFRTVIAYFDGQSLHAFEGSLEGHIATREAGEYGFGYDSIFVPEGSDRSLAQHEPARKSAISHRARALAQFSAYLSAL